MWILLWESIMHKALILNVDLYSTDVDEVAPPPIKFSDAKCHASLLFNFLICNNYLHFGVTEIIRFQKLVGDLNKATIANLGRQHHYSFIVVF